MRERRTAGDPYWSYTGELSFVRWPEPKAEAEIAHLVAAWPIILLFLSAVLPAAPVPPSLLQPEGLI